MKLFDLGGNFLVNDDKILSKENIKKIMEKIFKKEIIEINIEGIEPVAAEASPVVEPFKVCTGLAEEFKLHLLKLTHTEDEVAGGYLVAE